MSCRIIQQQNHRSMIFCSSDRFQDAFSSSFLDYFLECEPGSGPPSTVAIVSSPSAFFRITSVFSTCSDPKIYFILFFFFCIFLLCSFDSIWRDSKNYSNLKWRIFGDLFGSWIKIMPSSESKFVEMDGKNCSLFPMLNRFHSIRFEKWP